MARQIQIRRGTASAHENFIGAIGEITMDTNENTLRVHDGKTPGGTPLARVDQLPQSLELPNDMDYVIESYSSDTYWYRKYKSGWIEQGGETGKGANIRTLNIPIPMANSNYNIQITVVSPVSNSTNISSKVISRATNSFQYALTYNAGAYAGESSSWMVSGFCAP